MPTPRPLSLHTREAAALLGRLIRLARKRCRWSESALAERAGIARATVQRIEKGDPTCSIGLVFEAATLVGVPLFDADASSLAARRERTDALLALLPASVRRRREEVDDDF